jgi:glyoxylase I family protein
MSNATFSHIAVSCKNPLALETFYSKHFGFTRARVYAPGPDQVVMIKSGSIYLELFKAEGTPPTEPQEAGPSYPCWKHICFTVDDLDSKIKDIGSDATITKGPVDMSTFIPGMRVAWLADPEGNIFELNQGYVDEEHPPAITI